jgi:hypothetical protein
MDKIDVPRCHVAGTRWWPLFCAAAGWLVVAVLATEIIAGAGSHHWPCDMPAAGPRRFRNRDLTWTAHIGALRYSLIACAHLAAPVANDHFCPTRLVAHSSEQPAS